MRVLMLHNHYQIRAGEDASFAAEARVLEEAGVEVERFTVDNASIADHGKLRMAADTVWSRAAQRELTARLRARPADVVHVQNFFPQFSPAVHWAARAQGAAVVQSLRNWRLLCVNGKLFRDGQECRACVGRAPWPGVRHGCYRDDRKASAVVAAMLLAHRALGTWRDKVDRFVVLSDYARKQFVDAGLPAARLAVKPNFVHPDPGVGAGDGGYALYAGRLAPEKGVLELLAAWRQLDGALPLKLVGDGPLADAVAAARAAGAAVEWLGPKPGAEVLRLMGAAALVVVPSAWAEPFGRVAVEAFAKGTPVLTSSRGALAELVIEGETGLRFEAGDAGSLAAQAGYLAAHPAVLARMRAPARASYERRYSARGQADRLLAIYREALAERRQLAVQHAGDLLAHEVAVG